MAAPQQLFLNLSFHCFHNSTLDEITQRTYYSILEGERIGSVRFSYGRTTDEHWKEHMWDD